MTSPELLVLIEHLEASAQVDAVVAAVLLRRLADNAHDAGELLVEINRQLENGVDDPVGLLESAEELLNGVFTGLHGKTRHADD